jgi:transposase
MAKDAAMMAQWKIWQEALFYGFSLEERVPSDHLLRSIDRVVELSDTHRQPEPFHSVIGRSSVDPELMIRLLPVGYCCGICSERRLCEKVQFNLAYLCFCQLGLNGRGHDHSTFS